MLKRKISWNNWEKIKRMLSLMINYKKDKKWLISNLRLFNKLRVEKMKFYVNKLQKLKRKLIGTLKRRKEKLDYKKKLLKEVDNNKYKRN